ncbi:nickel-dependent hydrogenase large subunit [Kitasatospora sp. NPDC001660]
MTHRTQRTLTAGALARVEGEGALRVSVRDDEVETVRLEIYEPPRYFEALLRGRRYTEPPDLTARICGICPVAYQMSACHAIEDACGVVVDGQLAQLRRLVYCGEWTESHTLHVYLLHAPDFLRLPDALALARTDAALLQRGLRLEKAGNEIVEVLGGRAIHLVDVRIGGFHRLPTRAELDHLATVLRQARTDAEDTLGWVAGFEFPPPSAPAVPVPPRAGTGYGAAEAPRGLLYHRYDVDADGLVRRAVIVPPTAQSQTAIEADLRAVVQPRPHLDDAEPTRQCEQAIRNHDPCISCAAHFLTLTVDRR